MYILTCSSLSPPTTSNIAFHRSVLGSLTDCLTSPQPLALPLLLIDEDEDDDDDDGLIEVSNVVLRIMPLFTLCISFVVASSVDAFVMIIIIGYFNK